MITRKLVNNKYVTIPNSPSRKIKKQVGLHRNKSCYCNSGKKWKNCCMRVVKRTLEEEIMGGPPENQR